MTHIDIKALDPGDQAEVDSWIATMTASLDADLVGFPPENLTELTVRLARRQRSHRKQRIVAKVDGQVIACASLYLPLLENKSGVELELDVHPGFRRQGIGTTLLAEVERYVRGEGRNIVLTYVADTVEGGYAVPEDGQRFARRHGYELKLQEIRRSVDLSTVDQSEWDELLGAAWAKAQDYELVQWTGFSPEDVVAGLAYLNGRLVLDAPMGDITAEPHKTDVARIREHETEIKAAGQTCLSTVLRHRETGTVAGWSDVYVPPAEEQHSWQGITIVDPDHRGHRLGTIAKIENHRQLLRYRPLMRYVTTFNAEVNDFMININEAMGYRAGERWLAMEKDLGK